MPPIFTNFSAARFISPFAVNPPVKVDACGNVTPPPSAIVRALSPSVKSIVATSTLPLTSISPATARFALVRVSKSVSEVCPMVVPLIFILSITA